MFDGTIDKVKEEIRGEILELEVKGEVEVLEKKLEVLSKINDKIEEMKAQEKRYQEKLDRNFGKCEHCGRRANFNVEDTNYCESCLYKTYN